MDKGYMAGLIEGEGSFGLYLKKGYYQPRFSMTLRDDDEIILKDVSETLQIKKKLWRHKRKDNHAPQAGICLEDPNHLIKLIAYLDENPFIGKKRPQYEIWKEAVLFIKRNRYTTRANPEWRQRKRARLDSYYQELKELKEYKETK